jgi:DNA-binding winged helix-turn-helix (wHTH) protein
VQKSEQIQSIVFGPYELAGRNGQLLHHTRPLPLSPKAVAVLWTLVTRAGQVVSKEELFGSVWPETVVSEGTITNCISELRRVLGDATAKPRYIETVSRRGYRFIAPLTTTAQPVSSSKFQVPSPSPLSASDVAREAIPSFQPGTWNLEPRS